MTRAAPLPGFDAIVLAGGRASRLGGRDKPGLVVGTATMVASVVSAATGAGAHRVVVVGPPRPELLAVRPQPPGGLAAVREDPPAAGPVPALRCGLASAQSPWVALLAADMPFLRACQLRVLLNAAAPDQGAAHRAAAGADRPSRRAGDRAAGPVGAVLVDDAGQPQWLAGCWQAAALRSAAQGYGGASLHALLAPLDPVLVSPDVAEGEPPPWLDCDTAEDLGIARGWQRR